MSGWSAAVWALVLARRPVAALTVAMGTIVALRRKLDQLPPAESTRLAGLGHLYAGRQVASAITRVWWPLALVLAVFVRRSRLPLAAAAIVPRSARLARATWPTRPRSVRGASDCRRCRLRNRSLERCGRAAVRRRAGAEVHELAGANWRLMSLHSSHTLSGIRPQRISRLNTMQPRQTANTDSNVAATSRPTDEDVRNRVRAEAPRKQRTAAEHQADTLRESLRWPGNETVVDVDSWRDHAGHELTERAESGAAEHPREEAVRQRNEHPPLPEHEERNRLQNDPAGHQSSRRFVDRIGEAEHLAHATKVAPTIPIGQLGITDAAM